MHSAGVRGLLRKQTCQHMPLGCRRHARPECGEVSMHQDVIISRISLPVARYIHIFKGHHIVRRALNETR